MFSVMQRNRHDAIRTEGPAAGDGGASREEVTGQHICPGWLGPVLASPLRRFRQNPERILSPWVREGMTVVEPGCGMGFFSLPLARLAGAGGRVVCLDIQERMLAGLVRRAERAGLAERIEARQCGPRSLGVEHLFGRADFVLAFAMVHEVPDRAVLFAELSALLGPAGFLLVAEPSGHISAADFAATVRCAESGGLAVSSAPRISGSRTVLLRRAG